MAILFRTTSDLTIGGMAARLTLYGDAERIRAELEPYAPVSTTVYSSGVDVTFTYGGESVAVSAAAFDRPLNALFDCKAGEQSVQIASADTIVYQGTAASAHTIAWKGDGSVPAPTITLLPYPGLLDGQASRISWTVTDVPDGYTAYTVGIWLHHAPKTGTAPVYTRSSLLTERSADAWFEHSIDGLAAGQIIFYRIAVALYEDAADADGDYAAYAEIDTPAFVCSGDGIYKLAPCDLRCGSILKNRTVTIRWDFPSMATEVGGVELDYAINGEEKWLSLYNANSRITSYPYTVTQDWDRIAFRVRARSTRSKYELSQYVYTGWTEIGALNVYIGRNGTPAPAAMVQIGTQTGRAVLHVG